MHKNYDANFATEPPADLPTSAKVKSLRKAWQDAEAKLSDYQRENARYAQRKTLNALDQHVSHVPAMQDAEQELREAELAAVEGGKPLPDRDAVLGPVKAKVDEYARTVPALRALVDKAQREWSEALKAELVSTGLKVAAKAQKAREEWERLYKAVMAAREDLERHGSLFTWIATAGQVETLPLDGASTGNRAEAWELSADGRLTTEAAIELGFEGIALVDGLVVMPDPVRDEAAEAEAEFWRTHKPRIHTAKPEGYGGSWEH
ncbi:hypothetical protein ABZ568_15060 [Streptomyces olindensis]|uniref:Uncharacterized protein n=1 Tax=Streptomyces olindensis TaxID=358823 RepID=A0ABV2XUM7_9ACTN